MIHQPCKTLCHPFLGIHKVIAGVPFKYCIFLLVLQKFMLLTDGIANLSHHGILSVLFLVSKAEIDGFRKWLLFRSIIDPLWKPYGRRSCGYALEDVRLIGYPQGE